METSEKRRSLFIPSIADIIFISIMLYLTFASNSGLLADGDTGYHVRAGEYILETHSIPKEDIFSYHTPALKWTAHEWLSEVIMAFAHRLFGLTGVVILFIVVISALYYLLFRTAQRYNKNILTAVIVVLLVIASSQIHWLARPHIFSLFIFFIWYYLLDLHQYQNRNYLYITPFIMLPWVNLHGGYIIGIILTGIYLTANLLKIFISQEKERSDHKIKTKRLGLTLIASTFVALINPYGYKILIFPFKLTSNKFIVDHVTEFMSPNFHEPMFFTYLLILTIALLAVSQKRFNIIEIILLSLFTYMSLFSARYIPYFGIIVFPILVKQADLLVGQLEGRFINFFKKRAERIASVDSSSKGYLWPIAALVIIIIVWIGGKIEFVFDEKSKPVAAVEFLKKEHIKGNMFNNDEFGDYMIYEAWPEYSVFFDGRSDMYGTEKMKEYFNLSGIEPEFDSVIDKYDISWIFFNSKSALSQYLLVREDWKLIYSDKVANIFLKDIPENSELIKKYKNATPVVNSEE
jgi:hypothetical protein